MAEKMTRADMYEKYRAVLAHMFVESGDGTSVCFDKLVYMAKNQGVEGADVYPGVPEDFDYAAFLADYETMLD